MARTTSSKLGWVLAAVIMLVVFVVIPILGSAATLWTDYLWYQDLGQTVVFTTRILSEIVVFIAFAIATFLVVFANLRIARSMAPDTVLVDLPESIPVQVRDAVDRYRSVIGKVLDKALPWVAVFVAWSMAASRTNSWSVFRLALTGSEFGYTDPQFGLDVGFYVFKLPALNLILDWANGVLVATVILSLLVHLVDGGIQPWRKLRGFESHTKAHLSMLLALIVLERAASYWMSIYGLVYSPRGQVVGASYTDVHAQIPAYAILIGISLLTAVALLLNIRYRGWKLPAISLGVWVAASILVGGAWPGLMQQFVVRPNEASLEAPYMERNIAMTRKAFELTDVKGRTFSAIETLTADAVDEDAETIDNVRLWDPNIVNQAFAQLQGIRPYYDFADVDVDRYVVDGRMRQVLVSVREMNSAQLAETAQTWVNRHLVYTHGYGMVMSPASEADTRGLPRFFLGDIPAKVSSSVASASPDLSIEQPRIYFGEDTKDYVVVGAGIKEFDYPAGEKNATYEYSGDTGVRVGGIARRLAWALRLKSNQMLFSEYVGSDSRVLLRRDIQTRLTALAPWLRYEDDPFPVLVDGRILWVIDAYTRSTSFPNANGLTDGTNYLRNSVKVTVDAFTGETIFYGFDPKDPILKAWKGIFPGLITDMDEMPEEVRKHLRYPQRYFAAQAEIYRTYHMTDPGVFYNKEDQWEIPGERKGAAMEPFFVLMKLPGQDRERFYLMQPYTPRNRDNMIGWMAVSCEPDSYGERTVYLFPKERVILGPEQVKARVNQDPVISPQLSLWNQRGSQVIFGNMLVVPIQNSIVYIQPMFLQAESTAIPSLTRVVVVYSDKVEMERTLEAALLKVFGAVVPPSEEPTGEAGPPEEEPAADVAEAQRLYEEAVKAQKDGDWATYGEKLEELGAVLSELAGQ